MRCNHFLRLDVCTFVLTAYLNVAAAWGHSDVFLADVGGRVAVGGANDLGEAGESFDLTTQVFEGVMIANFPPIGPADHGRDEPGIFALANGLPGFPTGASALPAGATVSLGLTSFSVSGQSDTLFYWNGAGAVDFQPIAGVQPGVTLTVDPNPIGTTGASGALHEHVAFKLDNGAAGAPADGVYLVSPSVSVAGLAASRPFFMVFLADALLLDEGAAEELEEALEMGQFVVHGKDFKFFEEAVEYVGNNLVVPEPNGGVLVVLAVASVVARGRWRKLSHNWLGEA